MDKELIGTIDTSNIKRCYTEGIKHTEQCPRCNSEMEFDSSDGYFSYPKNGSDQSLWFTCPKCDECYSLPIVFESKVVLTINGELKNE